LVLRDIETLMADPDLSAAAVARRLGVTPRYVHLLLEETGLSFTQHVLEKRLERAAALLRDPRQSERRIADIALESGFADLSHFKRSFRGRFGDTPSGIRGVASRLTHGG
jgi:AraC-like DNA-binding protein